MSKTKLIFLFLLLLTERARSQTDCDCKEAEALRQPMSVHFNAGRFDSAIYYTSRLLPVSSQPCQVFYQNWMAQIAISQKKIDSARIFLANEAALLRSLGCNEKLYVRHYNTLGRLYQELALVDSFVIVGLKGIDAAEKAGDYFGLSRTCGDLASAFAGMDQVDKALAYYRRALDAAFRQTRVPTQSALVRIRMAGIFLDLFETTAEKRYADSARQLAGLALETAKQHQDLLTYLEANEVMGTCTLQTGHPQEALHFAEEIIARSPRGVHLFDRLTYAGFSLKSKIHSQLNELALAEAFADSASRYANAFNVQMMVGAFDRVYQAAKANGHAAKSLDAYEKMTALKDSLFTLQKNTAVAELEKKYNQARNESTILELSRRKQVYLLLALAGLVAAVAVFLFFRQRMLQQRKNVLETEMRLNRARMNPHFFFNGLAALQKFALRDGGGQELASQLSRFSNIMRETLESTYSDLVTVEKEIEFLEQYLSVQASRFPNQLFYSISAAEDLDSSDLLLPSMIVQPFVENSIEHGFGEKGEALTLTVHFSKTATALLVSVRDNGRGLGQSRQRPANYVSRATQITLDRLQLLNRSLRSKASMEVKDDSSHGGVLVLLRLPLLYPGEKISQS